MGPVDSVKGMGRKVVPSEDEASATVKDYL